MKPFLFSVQKIYALPTLIISAAVAILIHFPEILSLSDHFEQQALFESLTIWAVVNEVIYTFLSLILLFWINNFLFRFHDSTVQITVWKVIGSFALVWMLNSMLGKFFVFMHQHFQIPAIDAMLHHYLHPLRDFIMGVVVTGSSYIIYLMNKQQRIIFENQQLRTESATNQYEALKSQLNPHMLFNSLNTLQSLIREDAAKASDYTQELSQVLRYTLQVNESQSVSLAQELKFARAYIFLLQMRYEKNLQFDIEIDNTYSDTRLPPMSLQVLIENAVKHNEISNRKPLTISIYTNDNAALVVANKIQTKRTDSAGSGIGLDNLSKRYKLLFQQDIVVEKSNGMFIVSIPLINSDVK